MRLKTTLIALLALILIAPSAHAQEASSVISRLDTIIKEMEALKAEFATLVASVKPTGSVLGSNASTKSVFTMSLAVGETNDDIKRIQKLLATDKEIYPYGVASGFFGPKTEEGIKNFQTRFGLDPVGVVGPATKALLELFFNAYPDENFPADVLKKKPQVLGASTSVPQTPVTPVVPTTPVVPSTPSNTGDIEEITAKYDGEEAKVKVYYDDGETESLTIEGDTKIKVVDAVAAQLGKTRSQILSVIEFTNADSDDEDEEDFNIDIEIDDEEVSLSFEFDGDEYEVEVDSTDEDDVLEEVADELDEDEVDDIDEDLKDAIEEALDDALEDEDEDEDDDDEIESITAQVANGEAEIEVEYGDREEESFTVEETIESEIVEAVADELNIDEDEVEDVIEFEYEDIDEIRVEVEDGEALAFVEFEDGTIKRIRINSDDEDEIIEALAEELDEDEDDIEDWLEIEYLD
jgi:peptidoglycan hydrolase-like protein with peptidoglycan-binding domain